MLGSVMRLELCWPRLCAKLLLLTFFLPAICIKTIFRRTMPGDKSAGFTLTSCILIMAPSSWHSLQKKLSWMSHSWSLNNFYQIKRHHTWLMLRLDRFIKCSLSDCICSSWGVTTFQSVSECQQDSFLSRSLTVLDSNDDGWALSCQDLLTPSTLLLLLLIILAPFPPSPLHLNT